MLARFAVCPRQSASMLPPPDAAGFIDWPQAVLLPDPHMAPFYMPLAEGKSSPEVAPMRACYRDQIMSNTMFIALLREVGVPLEADSQLCGCAHGATECSCESMHELLEAVIELWHRRKLNMEKLLREVSECVDDARECLHIPVRNESSHATTTPNSIPSNATYRPPIPVPACEVVHMRPRVWNTGKSEPTLQEKIVALEHTMKRKCELQEERCSKTHP